MRPLVFAAIIVVGGCETKDPMDPPPTYAASAGELLREACAECHGGDAPAAGYSVETYLDTIYCVPDGRVAVRPADATAPIIAVLSQPDHADLLGDLSADYVRRWVEAGAIDRYGAAHPPGFTDPRSDAFHGAALRAASWDPMYDAESPGACGRCHDGAPFRPEGVGVAPGAPPCTRCHDSPEGVLDCATCHGHGDAAYPPRDPCFFGDAAGVAGAHAPHAEAGIDCADCHGERDTTVGQGGLHGDGVVEIAFSALAGGEDARYDPETGTCAVYCHGQGGTRPMPAWSDTEALDCQSCHASPPPDHYPGTCDCCHAEANADGTALLPGPLHANGVVDVGDGSGGCGACHGAGGDDAWPRGDAHDGHRDPTIALPVACGSCHRVPSSLDAPGHLNGVVEVELSGLAMARGTEPTFEAVDTSCFVACHGAGIEGGAVPSPRWAQPEAVADRCDACHGLPPADTHPVPGLCASVLCHGGEISETPAGPRISASGRAMHVDGVIDAGDGT